MGSKEVTLTDILAALKEQKEEINVAKAETDRKLEGFMNVIGGDVKGIKNEVRNMNKVMEKKDRENKENQKRITDEIRENERRNVDYQNKMDDRIARLEEALRRNSFKRMKQGELQQIRQNEEPESVEYVENIPSEEREVVPNERIEQGWKQKNDIPMSWSMRCKKQLETDATRGEKGEKEKCSGGEEKENEVNKVKKSLGMRKLKKWFGEESPVNSSASESESGGEDESWEAKVERRERNEGEEEEELGK